MVGATKESTKDMLASLDEKFEGRLSALESSVQGMLGRIDAIDFTKLADGTAAQKRGLKEVKKTMNGLDTRTEVEMACMYLVDDAKLWWRSKYTEIESGSVSLESWDDFKRALKNQFYPENTGFMARKKLKSVKHTKSIREYVKAFSVCKLEIKDMSEYDRVSSSSTN